MSVKLREFIRQVRASRTAAEERAVVARECARIRTNFRVGGFAEKRVGYLGLTLLLDESSEVSMLATNSLKQDLQHANQYVSSLALSALANGASAEVCRSLLPEVEQLLACSNPFIRKKAALAAGKCVRRLGGEIAPRFVPALPLLASDRSHGVLLGACALLFAVLEARPDLRAECRQHLLQPFVKALRACSSASYSQSAEYDIAGIVDPLLQSRLLRAVASLAEGDATSSAALTDVLAHVATNTDGSKNAGSCVLFECVRAIVSLETDQGKLTPWEAVDCLRVLGLNVLGRFLSSREQNLKYVALETLQELLKTDSAAVTRHRDTLLDCLKDGDASIRRRALEVLFALLSPENIRVLGRELLAFLLVCDKELKPFVASRLARAAETHAPTRRWQFDATLKLLCLAGNYVEDSAGHELLDLVLATPELQSYAVHKLFFCLREGSATSPVLCRVALYCLGEFGEMLVADDKSKLLSSEKEQQDSPADLAEDASAAALVVTSANVVETLAEISRALLKGPARGAAAATAGGGAAAVAAAEAASASLSSSAVTEALLTCLAKLASRLPHQREALLDLLRSFTSSRCLEVQQRSAEFVALFESPEWTADAATIFDRMPQQPQQQEKHQQRPVGEVCFDLADLPAELAPVGAATGSPRALEKAPAANGTGATLLELDDLLGLISSSAPPQKSAVPRATAASPVPAASASGGGTLNNGLDLLADLLGGTTVSAPAEGQQQQPAAAAPAAGQAGAPGDPFAALLDLDSPVASAATASAALCPPSANLAAPLASVLDSAITPPSPPPAANALNPLASVLDVATASSTSPAAAAAFTDTTGGVATVQVLHEGGLKVELKCQKGPSGTCEILAEFATDSDSKPLTQFRFEAAVPKYLQLQLEPPTNDVLLPGAPPVQQRMRVSNCAPPAGAASTSPPSGPKPLLMKCRVTFKRDGSLVQKCANVASFPSFLLGS
ncbi:hypothetical protein Esti_002795 [Eimeria stiedai]